MEFQRFETPGIAHYAYLIADDGEAAIVDPRRDVDEYLRAAQQLGVKIRYVIETHRQEDFVMGTSHLVERTGALVVNGRHELFGGRGDVRLGDEEVLHLGRLELRALHTPGHTPESMCYAIFTPDSRRQAWGVFTGDTLFFGDTGRTDLTDPDQTERNASLLYDMIHEKIAPLGDGLLVWPAHGPGSVCGSGMDPRPASSLAAERRYNRVFSRTRDAFAREKAMQRLPRPPYFSLMEQVNLGGGIPPKARPEDVPMLSVDELAERSKHAMLIDTRSPEAFASGHVTGAHAIWMNGLPLFGGWIANAETPILLVGERDRDTRTAFDHLSRIGIDDVEGALAGGFASWRSSGRPIATAGVMTPVQLAAHHDGISVLDVRESDEFDEGHIHGARHQYVGHLEGRLSELDLDRDDPVVVTCSAGNRSGLAVSILLRHGFRDVRNLLGGMTAWTALGLPLHDDGREETASSPRW
jgi:hydroxyacylglutathione hydrolase